VTSVVAEGHGIWSVYVTGHHLNRLKVEPGQFFSWRFLTGPGWTRANPYSLSAAPDGRSLRITVQGVGDGSHAVRGLHAGTRVLVEGPFGRLSPRARSRSRVAFIGAGVGSTPLRALAEGLGYAPGEAIYIERYTDQPLFVEELNLLAAERGLQVLRLPGRRRSATSWLGDGIGAADDLTALRYWVPDIHRRDVYVCGPEPWADLVCGTLAAAGVPTDNIHLETFAW
jgi:ferredoxin-NADP reductase